MRTIQMTVIGLAAAGALAAQAPADVLFASPLQVRTATAPTFEFIAGGMLTGTAVTGAPYTAQAVTSTTQTLADGNRIVNSSTSTIARDSEGRERREQSIANLGPFAAQGNPMQIVFISDPVAGESYTLNSNDKTAMKMPVPDLSGLPKPPVGANVNVMIHRLGAPEMATGVAGVPVGPPVESAIAGGPRVLFFHKEVKTSDAGERSDATWTGAASDPAPSAGRPNVEQLGSKIIEGVQATGTRSTLTIPAGQIGNDKPIVITDERWYSTDLQVTMLSEHDDPRMGKNSYALKNVSRGEPSPTLFQVPADYTVRNAPEPFTQKLP